MRIDKTTKQLKASTHFYGCGLKGAFVAIFYTCLLRKLLTFDAVAELVARNTVLQGVAFAVSAGVDGRLVPHGPAHAPAAAALTVSGAHLAVVR